MLTASFSPVMLDVAGVALDAADRRRLDNPLVGGVILFARNWKNRRQLSRLCGDIKAVRTDLLIAVDQEGGRVQRFRGDGFTRLPPMAALGRIWQQDPFRAIRLASACAYVLGRELRSCGVDFSFTPVLDLDWGHSSVIGDRALHRQPLAVATLAQALLNGLLRTGMAACGKHFPGHGWTRLDSHIELPRDARQRQTILEQDVLPYSALRSMLPAIMPAHVIYPRVDKRPAGFSKIWLQQILRGQLEFDGAIISDDLSMAAARRVGGRTLSASEAVLAALEAGCDLALLCNQSLDGGQVLDAVLQDLGDALARPASKPGPESQRRRLALLARGQIPVWANLQAEAAYRSACREIALNFPVNI